MNREKTEDFESLAEGRADTYKFLSVIYSTPLSKEFVKLIKNKNLLDVLSPFRENEGFRLLENFVENSHKDEKLEDNLDIEFTDLFAVPGRSYVVPYKSYYTDERELDFSVGGGQSSKEEKLKLVMGPSAVKAKKIYSSKGIEINGEMPDHISSLLEYMRFLCGLEAESWKENDIKKARTTLDEERGFLYEFLKPWIDELCEKIIENSKLDFYQGIAKITNEFIRLEVDQMGDIIEEAKNLK